MRLKITIAIMNKKRIKLHSFINIFISVNIDQNCPFEISWMIEYERCQTDPNNFDSVIILLLCIYYKDRSSFLC